MKWVSQWVAMLSAGVAVVVAGIAGAPVSAADSAGIMAIVPVFVADTPGIVGLYNMSPAHQRSLMV